MIASWWGVSQEDLRTIAARGCLGLVSAWESSILSALEDRESSDKSVKKLALKENPLDHKLVRHILPEYLGQLSQLQTDKAVLEARLKSAAGEADDDDGEIEGDGEELSADEVKALKKELTAVRKQLKTLQRAFVQRLQEARAGLDDTAGRDLALAILKGELRAIVDRYVAQHRSLVLAAFETWWDKYRTTLVAIERDRASAAERLQGFLVELGYGG